ncbi:MAG: ATP-binding cassette domain-containing protein [Thiolinea sp.]
MCARQPDFALDRRLPRAQRTERINTALVWAGLERIADTRAKTLSGGEYQRVALARAWLRESRVCCCWMNLLPTWTAIAVCAPRCWVPFARGRAWKR